MMDLTDLLNAQGASMHPVFQPDLTPGNTLFLDLSENTEIASLLAPDNADPTGERIFSLMREKQAIYGYGGYMEDRAVYRRSPLFRDNRGNARSIHLGTDIWAPAGTPVYVPLDATVHSFRNNDTFGDYGPTIIMRHTIAHHTFYCLYGHLSAESLYGLHNGRALAAGSLVGKIGDSFENGDWPPHLHFQFITDIQNWSGDYPGVCFPHEKVKYRILCPDPIIFFGGLRKSAKN